MARSKRMKGLSTEDLIPGYPTKGYILHGPTRDNSFNSENGAALTHGSIGYSPSREITKNFSNVSSVVSSDIDSWLSSEVLAPLASREDSKLTDEIRRSRSFCFGEFQTFSFETESRLLSFEFVIGQDTREEDSLNGEEGLLGVRKESVTEFSDSKSTVGQDSDESNEEILDLCWTNSASEQSKHRSYSIPCGETQTDEISDSLEFKIQGNPLEDFHDQGYDLIDKFDISVEKVPAEVELYEKHKSNKLELDEKHEPENQEIYTHSVSEINYPDDNPDPDKSKPDKKQEADKKREADKLELNKELDSDKLESEKRLELEKPIPYEKLESNKLEPEQEVDKSIDNHELDKIESDTVEHDKLEPGNKLKPHKSVLTEDQEQEKEETENLTLKKRQEFQELEADEKQGPHHAQLESSKLEPGENQEPDKKQEPEKFEQIQKPCQLEPDEQQEPNENQKQRNVHSDKLDPNRKQDPETLGFDNVAQVKKHEENKLKSGENQGTNSLQSEINITLPKQESIHHEELDSRNCTQNSKLLECLPFQHQTKSETIDKEGACINTEIERGHIAVDQGSDTNVSEKRLRDHDSIDKDKESVISIDRGKENICCKDKLEEENVITDKGKEENNSIEKREEDNVSIDKDEKGIFTLDNGQEENNRIYRGEEDNAKKDKEEESFVSIDQWEGNESTDKVEEEDDINKDKSEEEIASLEKLKEIEEIPDSVSYSQHKIGLNCAPHYLEGDSTVCSSGTEELTSTQNTDNELQPQIRQKNPQTDQSKQETLIRTDSDSFQCESFNEDQRIYQFTVPSENLIDSTAESESKESSGASALDHIFKGIQVDPLNKKIYQSNVEAGPITATSCILNDLSEESLVATSGTEHLTSRSSDVDPCENNKTDDESSTYGIDETNRNHLKEKHDQLCKSRGRMNTEITDVEAKSNLKVNNQKDFAVPEYSVMEEHININPSEVVHKSKEGSMKGPQFVHSNSLASQNEQRSVTQDKNENVNFLADNNIANAKHGDMEESKNVPITKRRHLIQQSSNFNEGNEEMDGTEYLPANETACSGRNKIDNVKIQKGKSLDDGLKMEGRSRKQSLPDSMIRSQGKKSKQFKRMNSDSAVMYEKSRYSLGILLEEINDLVRRTSSFECSDLDIRYKPTADKGSHRKIQQSEGKGNTGGMSASTSGEENLLQLVEMYCDKQEKKPSDDGAAAFSKVEYTAHSPDGIFYNTRNSKPREAESQKSIMDNLDSLIGVSDSSNELAKYTDGKSNSEMRRKAFCKEKSIGEITVESYDDKKGKNLGDKEGSDNRSSERSSGSRIAVSQLSPLKDDSLDSSKIPEMKPSVASKKEQRRRFPLRMLRRKSTVTSLSMLDVDEVADSSTTGTDVVSANTMTQDSQRRRKCSVVGYNDMGQGGGLLFQGGERGTERAAGEANCRKSSGTSFGRNGDGCTTAQSRKKSHQRNLSGKFPSFETSGAPKTSGSFSDFKGSSSVGRNPSLDNRCLKGDSVSHLDRRASSQLEPSNFKQSSQRETSDARKNVSSKDNHRNSGNRIEKSLSYRHDRNSQDRRSSTYSQEHSKVIDGEKKQFPLSKSASSFYYREHSSATNGGRKGQFPQSKTISTEGYSAFNKVGARGEMVNEKSRLTQYNQKLKGIAAIFQCMLNKIFLLKYCIF